MEIDEKIVIIRSFSRRSGKTTENQLIELIKFHSVGRYSATDLSIVPIHRDQPFDFFFLDRTGNAASCYRKGYAQ